MPSPNWDGPRPLGPWAERRGQHRHVNSFPRPRSEISPHGGRHRTDREGATTALAVCPAPPPQRPSALHQPVKAFDADLIGLGWCCRRYLVLALIRAPSHLLPDPVIDRPPTSPASPTASLSRRQNGKHVCPCRASAPRPKKTQTRVSQRCGWSLSSLCALEIVPAGGRWDLSWSWAGWVYSDGGIYLGYIARCIAMV